MDDLGQKLGTPNCINPPRDTNFWPRRQHLLLNKEATALSFRREISPSVASRPVTLNISKPCRQMNTVHLFTFMIMYVFIFKHIHMLYTYFVYMYTCVHQYVLNIITQQLLAVSAVFLFLSPASTEQHKIHKFVFHGRREPGEQRKRLSYNGNIKFEIGMDSTSKSHSHCLFHI